MGSAGGSARRRAIGRRDCRASDCASYLLVDAAPGVGRFAELGGDGELEAEEDTPPTREEIQPLIVGMLPEWKTFGTVQRNLILKQIVRCIRVYPRPSRYERACLRGPGNPLGNVPPRKFVKFFTRKSALLGEVFDV